MNVSVFGLGYVGCVSAACLAHDGHEVIGVDISPIKRDLINAGRSPIVEPELDELVSEAVKAGRLRVTGDPCEAVQGSDVSFICVGTPSAPNGSLDLQHVRQVAGEVGRALGSKAGYHLVVLRSTVLPGSTEAVVVPTLERESGKRAGEGFGVAYNPEFLREGSGVADFRRPPKTVIGVPAGPTSGYLDALRAVLPGPIIETDIRTAETVKYADNAFHALKIAFANEIGAICGRVGVDSHRLMAIFVQDTALNLSPAYLKPGYAFGGSCLPKDLRALTHMARSSDTAVPLLESVLASNDEHKKRALELIVGQGKRKVGVLGLSFKDGTDDLRESPTVELVEHLVGKGHAVQIYDRNVSLAQLIGANKTYIERQLPHIGSLLVTSLESLLNWAEVVVITTTDRDFGQIRGRLRRGQVLVDLVKAAAQIPEPHTPYFTLVG